MVLEINSNDNASSQKFRQFETTTTTTTAAAACKETKRLDERKTSQKLIIMIMLHVRNSDNLTLAIDRLLIMW